MKKMLLKCLLFMAMISGLTHCSKPMIFTELDISFKNLDEVFPEIYKTEKKIIETSASEIAGFSDFRRGKYGQLVSLEVWEFSEASAAQRKWDELVTGEKKRNLTDFTRVNGKESRFEYVRETGPSGMIWTNKMFLFRILAENKDTLTNFLKDTKVARLR